MPITVRTTPLGPTRLGVEKNAAANTLRCKRIRKNRASNVRASPYWGGVIPPARLARQLEGTDPLGWLLTPVDAAAFLGMSPSNLEKRRKNKPNEPPFKKRGRKWIRYQLGELVKFRPMYKKYAKTKSK